MHGSLVYSNTAINSTHGVVNFQHHSSVIYVHNKNSTTNAEIKLNGQYTVHVHHTPNQAVGIYMEIPGDYTNIEVLTAGVDISAETIDGKTYDYLWSTGATTPTINVTAEGKYSVTISLQNCSQSDNVKIVDYCPTKIYFPSAFSPNNDGVNETFFARGIYVEEFELMIFNRWGELIYKSTNFNEAWDGTYQGSKVQENVYIWKVLYKNNEASGVDSKQEMMGKVAVLH